LNPEKEPINENIFKVENKIYSDLVMEINEDLIRQSSLYNVHRQVIHLDQTFASQKNTTSEDSTQLDQYSQTSGLREQILKII